MKSGLDTISLDLPGTYKYLNLLGACIETMLDRFPVADREETSYGIQLAAHECCTNIVEHAYKDISGRMKIILAVFPEHNTLSVDVSDTGAPFKKKVIKEPDQTEPQTKGYGLFLVNQIMDEVVYTSQRDGNHWRLSKKLSIIEEAG